MNKIFSNKPTHSYTCPKCGEFISQNSCEIWADVPNDEIDFVIEDNTRMEEEWMDDWYKRVEVFEETHQQKCGTTHFN